MKAALQLNLGQQLTLTPQLQQAIRLLQLSRVELEQEIQTALDSNVMLERTEESQQDQQEASIVTSITSKLNKADHMSMTDSSDNTPWEIGALSGWQNKQYHANEDNNLENYAGTTTSLKDYLTWQLRLTHFSERDQEIGLAIIDAISEHGFLCLPLEDIHASLTKTLPDVEQDELDAMLNYIQTLDPPGVGARDLRECLLLQLHQLPDNTPWRQHAQIIVENHLTLLAQRHYKDLQKYIKVNAQGLKSVVHLIQSLNPRPGNIISADNTRYIVPDVLVRKHQGQWVVHLNPDSIPNIQINRQYALFTKQSARGTEKHMLREQLQEARWFLKSLQSRNETLLKVVNYIVAYQKDFFEHGETAMKPLVLSTVADAIGMHESTISRVTTQKYMHTPRGIFELKYFFSSHVQTSTGGECSATAIRALIKHVVAEENPQRPLSDNKIAQLLKQQGINVARRTIAKYRESLGIASSSERKQL